MTGLRSLRAKRAAMAGLLAVRWARREDTRHEQRLLVGVQPRIDRLAIELHVLLDLRLAVGIVLVVEIDGDRVEAGRHAAATVRRHRASAVNLSSITSPAHGVLESGTADQYKGCSSYGKEAMFFISLQPGDILSIQPTQSSFDNMHSAMWSDTCPTRYASNASVHAVPIACVDSPDTKIIQRGNTGLSARTLWFIMEPWRGSDKGSFTIAWNVSTWASRTKTGELCPMN